jgi:manganese/zinc/iron transport system substrate-binding protein
MSRLFSILFLALGILGCQSPERADNATLKVVCTTGMVGDAVAHLMGEHAEVKTLMGPGVDPHLYKATQGDIEALTRADLIVYNGLHLEGKMTEILEKLSSSRKVYAVGELLPANKLINSTDYVDAHDPHIWFDVALWEEAISELADELKKDYPEFSSDLETNSASYADTLKRLHLEVAQGIKTLPERQRVLITAHDAFKYFGKAYGMDVKGLQGISTASEYGLRDVSDLVNFVSENNIKAIFVESSVPRRSIEAVIEGAGERGHDLVLGGELYSDAMGSTGTPEGTYTGMVRHNLNTIVKALK